MKRFAKPCLLVALGIAVGISLGLALADGERESNAVVRNPDALNVTLPRDFFCPASEISGRASQTCHRRYIHFRR